MGCCRDIKDTTVGTLSQRITNQVHGLKGLNSKLLDIRTYLEKVASGKLPINHHIIYQLQDVFNLLPDASLQEFVKAFYLKTNDQMVVVYLASLIRWLPSPNPSSTPPLAPRSPGLGSLVRISWHWAVRLVKPVGL